MDFPLALAPDVRQCNFPSVVPREGGNPGFFVFAYGMNLDYRLSPE